MVLVHGAAGPALNGCPPLAFVEPLCASRVTKQQKIVEIRKVDTAAAAAAIPYDVKLHRSHLDSAHGRRGANALPAMMLPVLIGGAVP